MRFPKFMALCLAGLCLGLLTMTALAASLKSDVTAAAGYCQGDEFYAFVSTEDAWPDTVTAKAQLDGSAQAFSMEEAPLPLGEGGCPVSYLLLVDRSGSMRGKRSDRNPQNLVQHFAGALYDAGGDRAKFAVATFDENFNNDATDYTDNRQTLLEGVNSIQYDAQKTDLTKSILEALDYLEAYHREAGELVNLVLITDGIPDGGEERLTPAAAAGRIDVSQSILFHTFGIGTSDSKSPDSLDSLAQLGRGAHTSALNSRREDAEAAALETASLVSHLYTLRFSLGKAQSEVTDAMIYFYDQAVENGSSVQVFTKLTDVPVLGSTGEVVRKAEAKPIEDFYPSTAETSEGDGADEGETSSEQPGEEGGTEEPAENPSGESAEAAPQTAAKSPSGGETGQGEEKSGSFFPVIPMVFAGIALLAALVAGVYLVLRRKRASTGTGGGMEIYMRLEVISGQVATKEQDLYLRDELIIGRARSCDIVLKEPDLAKQCARVFLSDHIIWIEDIGAADGVYLGGMRLYNANRLRSGDEISIGNTRFQLKF